jgi:hypothetical protein
VFCLRHKHESEEIKGWEMTIPLSPKSVRTAKSVEYQRDIPAHSTGKFLA